MNRILCILAAGAMFTGCATTSGPSGNHNHAAKDRSSQLRQGMTRGDVRSLLGAPDKVEEDDNEYHRGHAYIPYYGWHHHHGGEPELKWEYRHPKVEVTFRRNGSGNWVVKEWDR